MNALYYRGLSFPMKFCSRCKGNKLVISFDKKSENRKDGHGTICKDCKRQDRNTKAPTQYLLFIFSKVCSRCGDEKDISQFSPNYNGTDSYYSICNQCREEPRRIYREAHHEQIRDYLKRYDNTPERIEHRKRLYQERCINDPDLIARGWQALHNWGIAHPLKVKEIDLRHRAAKLHTTVEYVDYEAILERDGSWCHICNQSIDLTIKKGPASLAFDHVIPLLPRRNEPRGTHEIHNIKPSHSICNKRKSNRPLVSLSAWTRRGPDSLVLF